MILNNNNIFFRSIVSLTLTSSLLFSSVDGYLATVLVNGDGLGGGTSGGHGTVKYFPTPGNQNADATVIKNLATNAQTGAVWGMAYDAIHKTVYVSAVVKRHIGLGNGGTGGIYSIDVTDIDNPSTTLFTTIANAGTISSNSDRNLPKDSLSSSGKPAPSRDPIFDQVGKMGLGDIDLSTDKKKLYTINLNTKSLVEIDIATKVEISYSIGDLFGDCGVENVRPWAVNTQNNQVHIGAVCENDLAKGSVVAKLNSDGTFTKLVSQPLDELDRDRSGAKSASSEDATNHNYKWLKNGEDDTLFAGDAYPHHPQLILSDIEFAKDNSLILGYADRSGLQAGYQNYAPNTSDDVLYFVISMGDIKKVCYTNGTYFVEGTTECPVPNDNNEFFVGDRFLNDEGSTSHFEVGLGGLAYEPVADSVGMSVYDPVDRSPSYTSGVSFLSNDSGNKIVSQLFSVDEKKTLMAKAGGVGDVEILETIPTYTLGDRVWLDTDENGVQDNGEGGVNEITVNLYSTADCTGTITEKTKTKSGGTASTDGFYEFVNLPEGDYCVEFKDIPANHFITKNTGTDDATNSDVNVSNAQIANIHLTENDPNEDMGIYEKITVSIGSLVWEDLNFDGKQDNDELGIKDAKVTLLDKDGNVMTTPAMQTTVADGKYYFSGLDEGNYSVLVTPPSGYVPCKQQTKTDNDVKENDSNIKEPKDGGYVSGKFTLKADAEVTESEGKSDTDDADNTDDDNGDMTVDFCFYRPASLGDYVWHDENKDGIQDASEKGVSGVSVKLLKDCDVNTVAGTTTTDADGKYKFASLNAGDYCVEFTLPKDMMVTSKDSGDGKNDSDVPTSTPYRTDETTLDPAENDMTWDMGIHSDKAAIGDFVWNDLNKNGLQDKGESGVGGVTVKLHDNTCTNVLKIIKTKADGSYIFEELTPATYCLEFADLPEKFVVTKQDSSTDASDSSDSDVDATSKKTIPVTLDAGQRDLTWDMGIYNPAKLGDKVWYDSNANGLQDDGETGVKDVTVVLLGSDCSTEVTGVTPQKTDADGNYLFTDLVAGEYCVEFKNIPDGYAISPQNKGNVEKDSDVNVKTGITEKITLNAGDDDRAWDMGIYQEASIGDYVWNDANANGVQEGTESGVANVTVTLYDKTCKTVAKDSSGVNIPTATTDANGLYKFEHLMPSEYCLGFTTLPNGYGFTPKDSGSDDTKDSDVNPATGKTSFTELVGGENDMNWDAGIFQAASIGDMVWYDKNANGIQDTGETGVKDVTVKLYKSDCTTPAVDGKDVAIADVKTDKDGKYAFTSLVPNDYCVGFDLATLPKGYKVSPKNKGTAVNDSDADEKTGLTKSTKLNGGDNDTTWDMGIYSPASIGNFVWLDTNANGVQDVNETGVANVTVTLYDGTCATAITSIITGGNGEYGFSNLIPGKYCVGFEDLPAEHVITKMNQGNDLLDSDVNPASRKTIATELVSGENDPTWDMGIYLPASIGDKVWLDSNGNGQQDSNESGVENVVVNLYKSDCSTPVTKDDSGAAITFVTTDSNGLYSFNNLTPNDYCVGFSIPNGYVVSKQNRGSDSSDSDVNPVTGKAVSTTLVSGENDLTWDLGIYKPASIGNLVWNDINADGIQDAGEVGLQDVTVTLYNCDCTTVAKDNNGVALPTVQTDSNGIYSFNNLRPQDYCVGFTVPTGYSVSPQSATTDDTLDSDVDVLTHKAACTTLSMDENDTSWDMGVYESASIGNLVWLDDNRDGLQSAGEAGVKDVTVKLLKNCTTVIKSTTTDANGNYLFTDLIPADYCVEFTKPSGYSLTFKDAGDDEKDSDADRVSFKTEKTTLVGGENDLTWDMGLYELSSLGNFVWYDNIKNGIQDSNETGVSDVNVTLYTDCNTTRRVLSATQTDANGYYLFENLEPNGDYCIGFENLPEGYQFTVDPEHNLSSTLECIVDTSTGITQDINLPHATNDLTWDMGIIPKCTDEEGRHLEIHDDSVVASTLGATTTIDILENDFGNLDIESIKFIKTEEGEVLYESGTAVAGTNTETFDELVVEGEGVWKILADGKITFTAETGFIGVPTPVYYIVQCKQGTVSNVAKASITSNCVCDPYEESVSDSVASLSEFSMVLLLVLTSTFSLFFFRRELEEKFV